MGEVNQELCNLIREAQGNRGQNQFAQQCNISSSAITRIMTGSYTPSAKVLAKIASKASNGITYEMLMNAAGYLTSEQQLHAINGKNYNPYFSIRLKQLRTEHGLTQAELGKIVNKGDSTVRMWELRSSEPDYETVLLLAEYFGVSVDYLLGKDTNSSSSKSKGKWINVYGRIAAGIPIEAIEDIIDQEEISAEMAANGEYIALKVKGSSMAPRIMDGDVVIIRLQEQVNNNEIAAVIVNGDECTLKKIKKEDNGLWLEPLNTAYQPLFYSKKQCAELPVRILGKMIELRAKF